MSEQNLYNGDARQKIKEMAESIDFAMMATNLKQQPIHMVPMSTKKVDEEGCIWFLSSKDSQHNQNLSRQSELHLVYMDNSSMQFLNIYGVARISTEQSMLRELYGSSDDAWFDGVDDPNLTAICVTPTHAYYWDPKSNRLSTLFKIGVSSITGEQPDLMNTGKLKV